MPLTLLAGCCYDALLPHLPVWIGSRFGDRYRYATFGYGYAGWLPYDLVDTLHVWLRLRVYTVYATVPGWFVTGYLHTFVVGCWLRILPIVVHADALATLLFVLITLVTYNTFVAVTVVGYARLRLRTVGCGCYVACCRTPFALPFAFTHVYGCGCHIYVYVTHFTLDCPVYGYGYTLFWLVTFCTLHARCLRLHVAVTLDFTHTVYVCTLFAFRWFYGYTRVLHGYPSCLLPVYGWLVTLLRWVTVTVTRCRLRTFTFLRSPFARLPAFPVGYLFYTPFALVTWLYGYYAFDLVG